MKLTVKMTNFTLNLTTYCFFYCFVTEFTSWIDRLVVNYEINRQTF